MIGRVIEIASAGRHLARERGAMTVFHEDVEEGRVPLDDIGVLLCNAHDLTYSNDLMIELARRGAAVVLCGENYLPVAWIWPLEGNHIQALRMRRQLNASLPLCKRLWQSLVKAKITQQENTLELLGVSSESLGELVKRVRSGDPDNVEAQAARRYWPLLFGDSFRRERFGPMPNPLLNYGYTVLRAATARAVVSAGLHPSLGIHHRNRTNSMCLVDDLVEPFRPLVDYTVAGLVAAGRQDMSREVRRDLAAVLAMDLDAERGTSPLQTCLERAAQSLAQSFEVGKPDLILPGGPLFSAADAMNA
ncbi:MAG: type II CRISPR-associated endonuclease Cas1 [Caldilineaceae bacterium SB0665_bin_25]|nr:type II CRISPR-associated endonuclease Cas1 [Caldilineaceae bacterium SB0665_bin_25]